MIEEELGTLGVTATYYPQVLTGYDTSETLRDPSEATAVSVSGIMSDLKLSNEDDSITRSATFSIAYSASLGFVPVPTDRVVIDSKHYRVTVVEVAQWGDTPMSYTLTLKS